jgi:hypothetical protein
MKITKFYTLLISGLTFAGGFFSSRLITPRVSHDHHATLSSSSITRPLITASSHPLYVDNSLTKQDIKSLREDPFTFFRSLGSLPDTKKQARILSAINELSLPEIQEAVKLLKPYDHHHDFAVWANFTPLFTRWAEVDPASLLAMAQQKHSYGSGIHWTAFQTYFQHLTKNDPERSYTEAITAQKLFPYAKRIVITQMSMQQPEKALSLLLNDPEEHGNENFQELFSLWASYAPEQTIAALEKITNPEHRKKCLESVAKAYTSREPEQALRWAQSLSNSNERETASRMAIKALADTDPVRAKSLIDAPDYQGNRQEAMNELMYSWAKKDYGQALIYVKSCQNSTDQKNYFTAILKFANTDQKKDLLNSIDQFNPAIAKTIYSSLNKSWAYDDNEIKLSEAYQKIKSPGMKEQLVREALEESLSYMSDSHIAEKKALFAQLQPSSQTPELAKQIAWSLVNTNHQEAITWAESLSSEDLKNAALKNIYLIMSSSDPKTVAEKAKNFPTGDDRTEIITQLADRWYGHNQAEALSWIRGLSGADQNAAMSSLIKNQSEASATEAQKLFDSWSHQLTPADYQNTTYKNVASTLARSLAENDAQNAITWLHSVPAGPLRDEAIAGISEKWSTYDPEKTSQWIATLPAGEGRDIASEKLVGTISRDDPASAWQWALSIQDLGRRRQASARVLESWKAYGQKDQARHALQNAGFSPEDTKELERRIE